MGKLPTAVTYKRRCAACKQREDACHGLALHYNCLTCIACKSFFYRSGKQLRAAGVAEGDMANRAVYEEVLDNHTRYSKCLAAGMDPVLVLDPSKRVASKVPTRRVKRSSSASGSFSSRRSSVKTVPTYRDACTQTPSCTIMPATFGHGDIPALLRALTQATRSRRAALALASAISTAAVAATAPATHLGMPSGQAAQTPMFTFHSGYTPRGYPSASGDSTSTSIKTANASVGGSTPMAAGAQAMAPPLVPDSTLCDPLFQQLMMANRSAAGASPMAGASAASAALGSRFQDLCPPSISTNVGHPPHHGAPTPTFAVRGPLSTTSVDFSGFDTPSSALLRGLCMMTP